MNVIIPIGGQGKRFSDFNYSLPKPLIKSLGKSIILRCIDSLSIDIDDIIFIPYRQDLDKYNFKDIITNEFNYKFKFIPINFETRGAAETVLFALEQMTNDELNNLTIVVDSDNVYNDNIVNDIKRINDSVVFYFEDKNTKPIFSYIRLDSYGVVTDIKEKFKISDNACSGAYGFKSGNLLKKYIIKTIKNNSKSNNEFYMSSIYNTMLNDDILIRSSLCNNYICLGTPEQLKIYSSNIENNEKLRFCFDLDNTLVTYPKIKGDYSTANPIINNINYLKFLKENGHTIIIHTARRMKTHNGDINKVVDDIGLLTIETLKKFDIPYDELYFGKPYANYYIDDLAIKSYDELDKELGFYNIHPETRSHNKIEIHGDKVIKYSSSIEGERYWYQNIPKNITNMFPTLIESNKDSITISKINGIPISYLNINKILTENIILSVLDSLDVIHNSSEIPYEIDVYSNYNDKLSSRINDFNFSSYDGFSTLINEIKSYFKEYKLQNRAIIGVVHGDSVFTNILINNFDNLQFIDMRGKLGETLTIYGDVLYDYAKVYQSIIGYDFILMGKSLDNEYINNNKKIFEKYITNKFDKNVLTDIKWITKNLLLSLIPIHNNNNCIKYYNLINTII
jgi:capsule biosynthesis phosphatase